jgi:hypothetical protein
MNLSVPRSQENVLHLRQKPIYVSGDNMICTKTSSQRRVLEVTALCDNKFQWCPRHVCKPMKLRLPGRSPPADPCLESLLLFFPNPLRRNGCKKNTRGQGETVLSTSYLRLVTSFETTVTASTIPNLSLTGLNVLRKYLSSRWLLCSCCTDLPVANTVSTVFSNSFVPSPE